MDPRKAGRAAKLVAKYGPHAIAAWKLAGDQAVNASKVQMARMQQRRHAVDQARGVEAGSVLRLRQGDDVFWVVLSGDAPVAAHPPTSTPLDELVEHADLAKRRTPEEYDAARIAARARRVVRRGRGGRRGTPPALPPD